MTTASQPQYDFLMEKIADKTLSFGCTILAEKGHPFIIVLKNYAGNFLCKTPFFEHVSTTINKNKIEKIIGHEPTLAMVLYALAERKSKKCKFIREITTIYEQNEYQFILGVRKLEQIYWNLEHDRLCDQSDATIIWLAELFGFKNAIS